MKKEYIEPSVKAVAIKPANVVMTSAMNYQGNYDSSTITIAGSEFDLLDEEP